MRYTTPLFLTAYNPVPLNERISNTALQLCLIIGVVLFFLWKTGKLKIHKKLTSTTIGIIVGAVLTLFSLIGGNPVWLEIGLSTLIISSFYAIRSARSNNVLKTYYPSFLVANIAIHALINLGILVLLSFLLEEFDPLVYLLICVPTLFISIFFVYIYFLPYLTANKNAHKQIRAIYITNVFAGWTVVAWIIALIWAHTIPNEHIHIHENKTHNTPEEIFQYKKLLDAGIITQEEFESKKKQLLDL